MTPIGQLSALPVTHALGWTLVHFCWQGLIICILLASVLSFLPAQASKLRYAAGCVAMTFMFLLPLITFGVLMVDQPDERQPAIATSSQYPGFVANVSTVESAEPWISKCESVLDRNLPAVDGFWIVGVVVLLLRLNLGLMAIGLWKSTGIEPASSEFIETLHMLRVRLGIERAVKLLNSARVSSPIVIGWMRPAILLPLGCMSGFSQTQIEAILAHELAHIRRHDFLVNLLQSIVETLFFYHPAVWWVSSQMRREREHCCDDLAVEFTGDRVAYASALSHLEQRRGALVPNGAVAATGGMLKKRIERLLGINQAPQFPRSMAIILFATATAVAGLIAQGAAHTQSAPGQASPSSSVPASNEMAATYHHWLNQEVRWIITPEEREAFLRLTSNRDRDMFIQQFWEKRSPSTDRGANPFRQEHYRRIAFANNHFAESSDPGWETGRGHVYIVFGQPDSIRSYPAGDKESAKPVEIWHYRLIRIQKPSSRSLTGAEHTMQSMDINDFDFRFIDECACGKYQLHSAWPAGAVVQDSKPGDRRSSQLSSISADGASDKMHTPRPDLACTYYGRRSDGVEGTCETRHGYESTYYCVNNAEKKLFEEQIGCEWKINRAKSLKYVVPEIRGQ
jgi:GWxTD domain-containing protein